MDIKKKPLKNDHLLINRGSEGFFRKANNYNNEVEKFDRYNINEKIDNNFTNIDMGYINKGINKTPEYSFQKSNVDLSQTPVYSKDNNEKNCKPESISFKRYQSSSDSSEGDNDSNIMVSTVKSIQDNTISIIDGTINQRSQTDKYNGNSGMTSNHSNNETPSLNFHIKNEFKHLMKHIMNEDDHKNNKICNIQNPIEKFQANKEDINSLNQIQNIESNVIKAS